MKDYAVTVSVQFQGMVADFRFVEAGFNEQDAEGRAEERVRNNLLIITTEVEEI